jgi:Calcineurin-like phosphoesterase
LRRRMLASAVLAAAVLPGSQLAWMAPGSPPAGAASQGAPRTGTLLAGTPRTGTLLAGTPRAGTLLAGTLLAAGDIPPCPHGKPTGGSRATAAIIGAHHGTVAPLGDLINGHTPRGDYKGCYGRTWGRYRSRTRPALGNHDYIRGSAAAYFSYFGRRAGPRGKGYYSYNLAAWHIVVINSNCSHIGGCRAGSPEERWLRLDLATHRALCTLAYWHKPLFTSGPPHSGDPELRAFWQDLYRAGADVILNGHNHQYERFAPQNPSGGFDPHRGIREFVVGTGGSPLDPFREIKPNSQARNATTYGVLKLTLEPGSYRWRFLATPGHAFTDSGSGTCVRPAGHQVRP